MGTLFNTRQGNIQVPKARVPDDGLYHPNEYPGGGSALTDSSNDAAHAIAVPAAAAADTRPVHVEWQARPEPTQYATQTAHAISTHPTKYATQTAYAISTHPTQYATQTHHAMSMTKSVASLTAPTSYETAGPVEATATMSPLVPASKPDHSAAYAIASVLVVVGLIGGLILYWLRKKDKRLRSKLTMHINPGQKPPNEPNPHMEQLKRLGCSIKSKSALSIEAISNIVKKNNDSSDQLRSLESNQSGTWPSLPAAATDDHESMPTQPPTKTERFKELGVKVKDTGLMKVKDTGLMIKEKSIIARDKGSDLVRDKSMAVKKGSAIMADKGVVFFNSASDFLKNKSMMVKKGSAIMTGKGMAFFNPPSDLVTRRSITADSMSNYSMTWSASTSSASSDRFHDDAPESIENSETPTTSDPVCEHNSIRRPSASALSVSLRNVSSGKAENMHSPTITAPSSCTVSRVSSLTAKSEAARSVTARSVTARSEPARSEPARSEPARSEPARSEPARSEPARSEPARSETARSEPARSEAARSEPAVPVPVPLRIGTHLGASTSSIEVFRKKVYRVDMPHKARSDNQLAVQEGEYAMISRIFDDGWAYCEMVDSNHKGLIPRACLSSWPSNRYVESPVTITTRCISPTGLGFPPRSPDVYTPPITQLSTQSRFYGADSVSDYGSYGS